MPVEFTRNDNCFDIREQTVCGSMKLVMAYDGSGRRISKTRMRDYGNGVWETQSITHYTGIGTEVREEFHNGTREKVNVVVNMPQGLGRYKVADASQSADDNATRTFEWYLKNHLGSTMLVYGTVSSTDSNTTDIGETKAAYDYRAFGEQVELLPHDLAKVTENFTGKEHDDEIALNYFGARYLDPMLGMWISVDPKRQYQNPYIYVGNNPIMGTDPDGLWGFSASVGVKGAVIAGGLINLSVNYDSERPEANKVMLTIGYGVGIDIGISKLKFKMFNKTLSRVEHVNGGPSDKDPKTGWHSQIDASLGALPIQGSFKDGETTPSSFGLGIGGGYYDTYTVDVGKFFNDKTENIRNEALEDQADINNTNLDSN